MTEMEPVTATPPETPPVKKSRVPTFFFGVFSGCLIGIFFFSLIAAMIAASRNESSGDVFSTQKVAIVPIEGEILEARETIDTLHRYAESATVRAIVMRINSPGGAVAPSQEIYEEILKIKAKSHKPIVASLD